MTVSQPSRTGFNEDVLRYWADQARRQQAAQEVIRAYFNRLPSSLG